MRIFGYEIKKKSQNVVFTTRSGVPVRESMFFGFSAIKTKKLTRRSLLEFYDTNPYFEMCVDNISKSCAAIKIEYKSKRGVEIEDKSSVIHNFIEKYCKEYSFSELTRNIILAYCATGEGFIYEYNECLYYACESNYSITTDKEDNILYIDFTKGSKRIRRTLDDVCFMRRSDISTPVRGRGFLAGSENLLSASTEVFNAEMFNYGNKGANKALGNKSTIPMLPSEVERINNEFKTQALGVENTGNVPIIQGDYNVLSLSDKINELGIQEAKNEAKRDICAKFELDSALFNDQATKSYNNRKEAEKSAYLKVYLPIFEYFLKEFQNFAHKRTAAYNEIMHACTDDIYCLREDEKIEHDSIREDVKAGILTVDEAKKMLYDTE